MDIGEILKKTEKRSSKIVRPHLKIAVATEARPYDNDIEITPTPSSEDTANKPETKWQQTDNKVSTKPTTNRQQSGNKQSTENHELETKWQQTDNKVSTKPATQLATKWQQTDNKVATKSTFSSLIGLQRNLVIFIYEICKNERHKITCPLTLEHLEKTLEHSKNSIKVTLQRLEKKEIIIRSEFKNGRGGWSKYELPETVFQELLFLESGNKLETKWQQTDNKVSTKPSTKPATNGSSSSSRDLDLTTTTDPEAELFEKFELACERFGLINFGINSNDLMKIWRKGVFKTEDGFLLSVEHTAFYFKTEEANSIQNHKAWFYKTLSEGHYAAPVGFTSWEERQIELELKAVQEKLKRIEESKQQKQEAEFEIWLNELSEEQKKAYLSETGAPLTEDMGSIVVKMLLKDIFLKKT